MTHTASDVEFRDSLALFGSAAEGTSLYLLRAITETVDTMQSLEKLATAVAEEAARLGKSLAGRAVVIGVYVDPEDTAINTIEAAYKALEEHLPKLLLRKASIDGDQQLDKEQAELLHTAYDRCIESIACLVESTKNLRAAVVAHDLAAEPPPATVYQSADELIQSLRAPA